MVRLVLIVEVHGGGRIVEHRQQILLHVPHRGGVLCQRFQHEADVVGNVNFRVDRKMIRRINGRCLLERAPWKSQRSSQKYTSEQRLALAVRYLEEHPFLTVYEYRKLTGLLRTAATNELRQWAYTPGSGIGIDGRGTHRVYIKKT